MSPSLTGANPFSRIPDARSRTVISGNDALLAIFSKSCALYFLSSRSGFFNVWARRFDPERGIALGEAFAVTQFNDPAQMIPPRTVQLGMSISRDRLIIPIASASGNIWVLEGVNH